ncbi:MAG: DUF748 domain-containing protein [Candidatus Omnitrophota bacterium]
MRDLFLKIIFIGVVLVILFFSAAYIFLLFQGKAIIVNQLQSLLKKKVSISHFAIGPLFMLQIENLQIEGMGKIDNVSISPSVIGFLSGNLAFSNVRLKNPELTFEKFVSKKSGAGIATVADEVFTTPLATAVSTTGGNVSVAINQPKINQMNLIFKHIRIQNGTIIYIDHTAGEEGIKLTLKDLNFNLSNLYIMPRSTMTEFELTARIPWHHGQDEGKIALSGWVNFFKKDMKVSLTIKDIDGIYLYPYYSTWVDLDKARIEKAKLNFESNIVSLNNDLTAECHLELTDIVRKDRPSDEPSEKAERIASAVLDIFKALNQGKIVLDFTKRTKMDKLELGFGDIRSAFEEKLASRNKKSKSDNLVSFVLFPAKLVEGTIKSATEISRAVIDGTFAVGNELTRAVKGSFKREPKEVK